MFEVNCPSARFNTHRQQYNRYNNEDLITIKVDKDGLSCGFSMTVKEAEQLAADLLSWTNEIKESLT